MCFNRTFMELKWMCIFAPRFIIIGFNRTFMELKYLRSAFALDKL